MSRSLAAAISDDTSGAPECCQLDPNSGSFLPASYVRPDADTWSFGCIASELATWIVRGMWGLQAYREARKDAHDDSWLDGDCFHEGYRTLPYIRTHHDRLVENLHMDLRNATIGALLRPLNRPCWLGASTKSWRNRHQGCNSVELSRGLSESPW